MASVGTFVTAQVTPLVPNRLYPAAGRMSAGMLAGFAKLQEKGIPIVVTTRVGGRLDGTPAYEFPAIVSNGQPDNKARILLMLGLTRASDIAELQRMFGNY